MATSGSVSTSKYDGRYYTVSWTATQSVSTNKSTVKWTLKAVGGNENWYAERDLKVVIAGKTVFSKTSRVERYKGTIDSGTVTITHDSNGDADFKISISAAVYGTTVNCTGSKTFTLTNIPRASTLDVADGTLGVVQTWSISVRDSDTHFKHKIAWECTTGTTTEDSKGYVSGSESTFITSLQVQWTPPLTLASKNTTGTTVSIQFVLYTYTSDGTYVGENSYTKTFSMPSSVKPSCSVEVTDPMGYADTYGGFIKGLSKFDVVVTPTISFGSDIASYSTTANGATYTEPSFTTEVLSSAGTSTIKATVRDNRGRSGSKTKTVTIIDYAAPIISKLTVKRCNADGTENDQGEHVKATFSGTVTSLSNKNKALYVLKYKKTSEKEFPNNQIITLSDYSNIYSVADASYVFEADSGSSYDVKLEVTDNFYTTNKVTSASTALTLMHWLASGLGMAIGKVAELAGVLDIGFQTKFSGGILHDVLADGTDLDTLTIPNTYYAQSSRNYPNAPVTGKGRFVEVLGNKANALIQRVTVYSKTNPVVYSRCYSEGSWGGWTDNHPYPVGSIYMSVNNTDPSTLFGGTWEQIKDMFLLSAGDTYAAGSTGGEAQHTLTVEEMPEHQHSLHYRSIYSGDGSTSAITSKSYSSGSTSKENGAIATGGGQAHNNMPPYLAVYVWKRIS